MKKINRFRSKYSTNNKEYKYLAFEWSNRDWDYGMFSIGSTKHRWAKTKKSLMWQHQYREYRGWKHNRKKQYK